MAAIGEKEAHIALLESNRDRPDAEIDALRRHKMGLMNKLQEENERRQHLLTPMLDAAAVPPGAALASVLPGAMFHSSGLDQACSATHCSSFSSVSGGRCRGHLGVTRRVCFVFSLQHSLASDFPKFFHCFPSLVQRISSSTYSTPFLLSGNREEGTKLEGIAGSHSDLVHICN